MPELPEVETVANDLRRLGLVGSQITDAHIHWERSIGTPSPAEFRRRIKGQTIVQVSRRAKYLSLLLSNGETIYIHLRMTGRFTLAPIGTPFSPYERVTLELDHSRHLQFHDTRKFGRWYLVEDTHEIIGKLGPEPLDEGFTNEAFAALLATRARLLKPLLLDQTFIAGLGNIYVDEALWYAKLHPMTISNSLTKKQSQALFEAIRHVLKRGLAAEGTTLGTGKSNFYRPEGGRGKHQDVVYVFRRTGLPCPRCGTPIERLIVAQRSTHICPNCQQL